MGRLSRLMQGSLSRLPGHPSLLVQGHPSLLVQGHPSLTMQKYLSHLRQTCHLLVIQACPSRLTVQNSLTHLIPGHPSLIQTFHLLVLQAHPGRPVQKALALTVKLHGMMKGVI